MNEMMVSIIHNTYIDFASLNAINDLYSDLILLKKHFFQGKA